MVSKRNKFLVSLGNRIQNVRKKSDEKSKTSAKCIICNIILVTEMSSLNHHLISKKHKLMYNSVSTTSSLSESFKPNIILYLKK